MRGVVSLIGCCLGFLNAGTYKIDTVAGSDWVGDNGAATLAILKQTEGLASDSVGNLYVADAANHRIRKITRAGVITTVAGNGLPGFSGDGGPASAAQLNSPYGLAMDGLGNLYVADLGNARVRRMGIDGNIVTIAGGGSLTPSSSTEGSSATTIALNAPRNIALDGYGSLYFSDFGAHRIYKVDATGALTTIAGTGIPGSAGDNGPATRAQLAFPAGLAFGRNGVLYLADSQNHAIRKIANGIISPFARAVTPTGMVIDGFGTMYVADPAAGQLLTFPGSAKPVVFPMTVLDLAFGADGFLYATQGQTVVRVAYSGLSATVAGGGSLASGDHGPAVAALLNHPSGVAADALGNIYIADHDNNRIRKIDAGGTITTIAGTGDAGNLGDNDVATQAQLNSPSSVTIDVAGNLYIADTGNHRVRKINPVGVIQPLPFPGLDTPVYALADAAGNVYVADSALGAILKRTPLGVVTTLAAHLGSPGGMVLDANHNLYFADTKAKRVFKLDAAGTLTAIADGIWSAPAAVTIATNGDLLIADAGLERIVSVDAAGNLSVVAGAGSQGFSGDGDDAASAQLSSPVAMTLDPNGAIFIADRDNNRIRRLTPQPSGIIAPIQLISAVNTASQQPGPIAPGMLLDLIGTNLTASDLPNIQVLFRTDSSTTFPAQILLVDAKRVELRVPPQLASSGTATIQILNNAVLIAQISAALAVASPGIFADDSGQAIAVNEDGTLNSAANPAARGSIMVLYGTGEGVTGQDVTLNVGGSAAEVLYAGPIPGYPGLLQINVRMPSGYIGPGAFAVTLITGGSSSQPGVTVTLN
jgi:uncharacterized protein (TIGR03437 family)